MMPNERDMCRRHAWTENMEAECLLVYRDAEQPVQPFSERAVDLGLTSQLNVGVQDFSPTVHKGPECEVPVQMHS